MTKKETKEPDNTTTQASKKSLSLAKKMLWFSLILLLAFLAWSVFPPKWPDAPPPPQSSSIKAKECLVTRDGSDVPHIEAKSKEALFFCWGQMHAMDRGWQMDFLRRRAYGRVAEVYGGKFIKGDFQLRLFRLKRVADRWMTHYRTTDPPMYRLLRFYTWGVNQAFAKLKKTGKLPYIWKNMGYFPPAWQVRDSLMIVLLQSFYQTRKTFTDDLNHARFRVRLGAARYQELFPTRKGSLPLSFPIIKPGEHPLVPKKAPQKKPKAKVRPSRTKPMLRRATSQPTTQPVPQRIAPTSKPMPTQRTIPDPHKRSIPLRRTVPNPRPTKRGASLAPKRQKRLALLGRVQDQFSSLMGIGGGSNNWVVAPKRTKNGFALLANDPHLQIRTPSFWHEVHLKGAGVNVMGVGVPGLPLLVSGNNEHIAFGLTNGFGNAADLILIRPSRRGIFKLGKKKHRVRAFRPIVWFKKGPFHFPIFWKRFGGTRFGPILPVSGEVGEGILFRWTGYHVKHSPFAAGYKLMTARNVKEADEGLKKWKLPNWNMVFADVHGGIGYRQIGLVAKRLKGIRGFVDGSDPKQLWRGFLSPDEMPHLLNPGRGFIVTANNQSFPPGYPFFLGYAYSTGHRARRIEAMLQAQKKHTLASMQKIQSDTRVPAADLALDLMLKQLSQVKLKPFEQKVSTRLSKWNRQARRNLIEPTIFRVWYRMMERLFFRYDIVRENKPTPRTQMKRKPRPRFIFRPGDSAIIRVLKGKLEPSGQQLISSLVHKSLKMTLKKLQKDLGQDWEQWKWKRYHKLSFYHLLSRDLPLHPAAKGMDGDIATVSPGLLRGNGPYTVRNAASYRLVVELRPGNIRSWGVLAGKQIDKEPKVLGPQQKLWLKHKYRTRPFYPRELKPFRKKSFKITF